MNEKNRFRIIAVTDLESAPGGPQARLRLLADSGADAVILRARQLTASRYAELAADAARLFEGSRTQLILHGFAEAAAATGCRALHLPLAVLEELAAGSPQLLRRFDVIGASVHSADEARRAAGCGAAYVTAGHVFATGCKPGLEPRGLGFLREVVSAAGIPVFAIGGIAEGNIAEVKAAGAAGACVMSGYMRCSDAAALTGRLRTAACAQSAGEYINS